MEKNKKQVETKQITNNLQTKEAKSNKAQPNNKDTIAKKNSSGSEKLETKIDDRDKKQEKKGKIKKEKAKKTEAVVHGMNLSVSTKHSVAICNYIWGKNIDEAILMLEEVEKFKKPIPMRGEIPHRRGKIMSGRYPIRAVQEFIKLLRSLKANAMINELEVEKYVIFCKADVAPRPYKRFGRARFKRTHATLKLILPVKKARRKK